MSDVFTIATELGDIKITKNAISKIISEAVDKWDGKVCLTNHKGKPEGLVAKMTGHDSSLMEIDCGDDGIDLKIYINVKFGTSIGAVTNSLIENIHEGVRKATGRDPSSVSVVVTGLMSKNLVHRNIEVTKQYES